MGTDHTIKLRRKSKKSYLLENVRACHCLLCAVNVTRLRFRDTPASSAAICFFHDISLYLLDIKSALTQKGLDSFCQNFHIPDDVHPQLPSPNQTKHEMPAGKIGVYTRFFDKRSDSDVVCYTKPLDSLKRWNDHFFWVDYFACPASFPWHTGKNVSRDPFPKSTKFNADDYAILVAHSAPFQKFLEPFLCFFRMNHYYTLDEDTYHKMDLSTFIHVVDLTKVKVAERECTEGEARLLDSTVRCVVSLLPVAPTRAESELEASVDRLFDEGGSADQGGSTTCGGQDVETELVTGIKIIIVENVIVERPKRQRKKRQAVTNASGSSHPPKKLRGDHRTSSGAATGGKSPSVLKELLACSILNVEAGVEAVATLPLVTYSISATQEHESGAPADSITMLNLRTIGLSKRTVRPDVAGSSHIPGKELSMGSWEINSETLYEVFVPQWNVSNDTLLDDHDVSRNLLTTWPLLCCLLKSVRWIITICLLNLMLGPVDKESSATGTDNRPPMLVESDYESWKIHIERYIHGKTLGKLIWRSIQNGPTPYPQITVTEGQGDAAIQVTKDKLDEEFTQIENNKELADIQATNILSQGLPRHVFNILNQTRTGKEIWDNVELLMKGSGKSLQQKKEELYDEYERFRAIGNESIHDYYVRFHT
ncbi:hypothetical protein Tco_1245747 [Tanacetum coccineum]